MNQTEIVFINYVKPNDFIFLENCWWEVEEKKNQYSVVSQYCLVQFYINAAVASIGMFI